MFYYASLCHNFWIRSDFKSLKFLDNIFSDSQWHGFIYMTALIAANKFFIRSFVSGCVSNWVSETLSVSKEPVLFAMESISIFSNGRESE